MSLRIEFHAELDSTQRRAHELVVRGVALYDAICADHQTAGRGRQGATWYDQPSQSLLVSLILREAPLPEPVGLISLLAALAAANALNHHYPELPLVQLKYPNDLVLQQRKLGGILTELVGRTAIVGIGINLAQRTFPPELDERAISVWQALCISSPATSAAIAPTVSREERVTLIQAIYHDLWQLLLRWHAEPTSVLQHWHARDASVGRPYRIQDLPDQPIGIAEDIESDFRLRLRLPDGTHYTTYYVSGV